jgi:hypothetical protein
LISNSGLARPGPGGAGNRIPWSAPQKSALSNPGARKAKALFKWNRASTIFSVDRAGNWGREFGRV